MTRQHLKKVSAFKELPALAEGFVYYSQCKVILMAIAQHNYYDIPAIIKSGPIDGGMTE